jgi:5-methylcytosine-specific restriction endonuclease McrA
MALLARIQYLKKYYQKSKIYFCRNCNKRIKKNNHELCLICFNKLIKTIIKPRYCLDCEKQLSKYTSSKRCHFCANKIMLKNRNQSGNNNPNYIDGRTVNRQYPKEFRNINLQIRERDDYDCQNCNMTEEEHLIVFGSSLEVHHIDYDKYNNKEYNLITLCKQCNVRANYNRNYWKEIYFLKNKDKNVITKT